MKAPEASKVAKLLRGRYHFQYLAVLLVALFSASCVKTKVIQQAASAYGTRLDASRKVRDPLSKETKDVLRQHKVVTLWQTAPDDVIALLHKEMQGDQASGLRSALIELCGQSGDRSKKANEAAGYYLSAAELAYEGMRRNASGEWLEGYNKYCGQSAAAIHQSEGYRDSTDEFQGPWRNYAVRQRRGGEERLNIAEFDELLIAEDLEFKHIDLERKTRAGVGAAMVGHLANTEARAKANPFLAPSGLMMTLNVTLEFGGGGNVALSCHDLLVVDRASVGGRSQTLSADFTAPLAMLLDVSPKHNNVAWDGMVHPDKYEGKMGLFQIEPFRRDQIPVVFVHGLMSSPLIWISALNELRADPKLRSKYQILAFYYPTGFPIVYNAHSLRSKMEEFQDTFDPGNRNPNMKNIVMIGHSMGGQLTNTQIRTSGDSFTKVLFERPIDQLGGATEQQKETFRELLLYRANPDISRVIFLASPHRGSDLAIGGVGSLGRKLIKFPQKALNYVPDPDIDGLTPLGRELIFSRPDSIKALAPNSPGLLAILDQPVRSGVKIHSVIGNHKMKEPLEDSSDMVVPYWSSHLDDSVSEVIVDSTHIPICENEDAIEEVRRILYLHGGLSGR